MECIWMVALTIVFQHKIITARIAFAKRSLAFYFHRNNNNNYSEWSFQHYCRRYLSLSASAYCIPNTYGGRRLRSYTDTPITTHIHSLAFASKLKTKTFVGCAFRCVVVAQSKIHTAAEFD